MNDWVDAEEELTKELCFRGTEMSNDRELLELAAKAAGLPYKYWDGKSVHWPNKGFFFLDVAGTPFGKVWNPLTDDGDALRLAVKLELEICFNNQEEGTTVWCPAIGDWLPEKHGDAPYAATRRAIVRAAAEIGRTMCVNRLMP